MASKNKFKAYSYIIQRIEEILYTYDVYDTMRSIKFKSILIGRPDYKCDFVVDNLTIEFKGLVDIGILAKLSSVFMDVNPIIKMYIDCEDEDNKDGYVTTITIHNKKELGYYWND